MHDYQKIFDITLEAHEGYKNRTYLDKFAFANQLVWKSVNETVYGPEDFGLISDFYKTFWVRIPKCANSNIDRHIRGILQPINFERDYLKFSQSSEYKGCVVLRDPFERWISGACTLYKEFIEAERINEIDDEIYTAIIGNKFLSSALIEYLIGRLLTDYHGILQSYYLYPCNINNLDFFYLHNNTGIHLNRWFKNNGIYNQLDSYKYNETDKNMPLYKFLNMFFMDNSNEKYKTKIKQMLQLDYDLINSIHFYNKQ